MMIYLGRGEELAHPPTPCSPRAINSPTWNSIWTLASTHLGGEIADVGAKWPGVTMYAFNLPVRTLHARVRGEGGRVYHDGG
jgi:hypothetical protein